MIRHILLSLLLMVSLSLSAQNLQAGFHATDSAWDSHVKSIYLERNGNDQEPPFIKLGSSDQLLLRFDVLGSQPEDFRYRLYHCNARWQVDDAQPYEFLQGFEEYDIENYENSFTTLQDYVHYQQSIPAQGSHFLLSGNYVLEVFLRAQPDSTVLTRRLCVHEELLDVDISVDKALHSHGDIWRDQEVNVSVLPHKGVYLPSPTQTLTVQVQQNRRRDAVHTLTCSGYDGSTLLYRWQEENLFPGGNCFRYFDCSNLRVAMYNVQEIQRYGGETFAILKPLQDRSRNAYMYEAALNGGMKTNVWDRNQKEIQADYVQVNFALPMDRPLLQGNIYIIGDLTQWRFDEDSRMEWKPEYKSYFKRLLLKQGYYSYQLLVVPTGDSQGSTAYLEGNHYETPNDYTVYVYMHLPGDRYDRLAAIQQHSASF